jgi:hypothetical protein
MLTSGDLSSSETTLTMSNWRGMPVPKGYTCMPGMEEDTWTNFQKTK